MTLKGLRDLCTEMGLSKTGNKIDLAKRIVASVRKSKKTKTPHDTGKWGDTALQILNTLFHDFAYWS